MKYIKRIFERLDINDSTKKVLSDFGVSEDEYEKMITFLGKLGLYDIRNNLPFLYNWDNFNIGYDDMRKLVNFYEKKIKIDIESKELEDYFLDLIDDKSQPLEVKFNHSYQYVDILFDHKKMNLLEISNHLTSIDKRFKRAKKSYKILSINRTYTDDMISLTVIRLDYSQLNSVIR